MTMPGKEQSKRLNIVVSSGTGTGNLTPTWDIARWIRVIPVSESDTYNLTIKDGNGFLVVTRTAQTGTLSENLELSLGIIKTVEISSASQDGQYSFIADLH